MTSGFALLHFNPAHLVESDVQVEQAGRAEPEELCTVTCLRIPAFYRIYLTFAQAF